MFHPQCHKLVQYIFFTSVSVYHLGGFIKIKNILIYNCIKIFRNVNGVTIAEETFPLTSYC